MSLKTLDHSETLAFHPWIGSNPTEVLDQLKVSAFRWNLMSTITTIAIGAISFSVVFASFFWAIPMPIMIVGGGILPTVLSFATSYFREQALEIEASIENGEAVALEFSKILSWNETQVLSFLKENNIPKPKEISLSDLLPLIARYVARCKQAEEYAIKSQELLASDKTTDREARL
ncbi:MAG TPA: hypothetical protein VLE96_01070 [Chlamydiales bacterium]|nr:hypothetical protein [Chlamydiales bacterium]